MATTDTAIRGDDLLWLHADEEGGRPGHVEVEHVDLNEVAMYITDERTRKRTTVYLDAVGAATLGDRLQREARSAVSKEDD